MYSISKYKELKFRYLNKNIGKEPFRGELFNTSQLSEYAKILAETQKTGTQNKNTYLLDRLNANDTRIKGFNNKILAAPQDYYISPATEWIVDNFYIIEENIQLARRHFPKSYSKELPSLTDGPYKGLPRVYAMAVEYISHTDAHIDQESLKTFFRSYQETSVLKIGELWAIPIMLRLILIENIQRIITQIQDAQKDRDKANYWMNRITDAISKKTNSLVDIVSEMSRSDIPVSSAFISQFYKRISSQNPSLRIVKNWIEEKLEHEGLNSEELVYLDNQMQAADQVSVSHSIKSLRHINSTDWQTFVESISIVDDILNTDPAGEYADMDFTSRDNYRHAVEVFSQKSGFTEKDIAQTTIQLSQNAENEGRGGRFTHVGYYLTGDGIIELQHTVGIRKTFKSGLISILKNNPLTFYGGLAILFTLLGMYAFYSIIENLEIDMRGWQLIILMICFGVFVSQLMVTLINWISTLVIKPYILPRLDFSEGIPYDCRTTIVIPAIFGSEEEIKKLLSDLEIQYLSNRGNNLYFTLLTDFADSDKEIEKEDDRLLENIRNGINQLNCKYSSQDDTLFYLFHRPRQWNAKEKKWMGFERKRGKLMDFNSFIVKGIKKPFSVITENSSVLHKVRYVITLDTDTKLPPDSAGKLVGTMAHILNRPVYDTNRNIIVEGYGILQPRVAINLQSSRYSLFSRLFTGEVGIDPYTRAVSDVYQDIFHEGSFVGKGIYDVEAFEKVLGGRLPENKILSHDLLESTYLRSGLVTDVEVFESYPASYYVDIKRRHRWMRGDWQIFQWILPNVPTPKASEKNPLCGINKWKIGDNLRRSLVAPAGLLFLLGFFIWFPGMAGIALSLFITAFFLPLAFTSITDLVRKPEDQPWSMHLNEVVKNTWHKLLQVAFLLVTFPYEAYVCTDAILRTLWRILFSNKHLLQWQTSEEASRITPNSLKSFYGRMWFSPLFSIICLLLTIRYPHNLWDTLPFALAWIMAPYISWYASRPVKKKSLPLTDEQSIFLRKIARKTWHFFEVFINEGDNWLPPDNFQEVPNPIVATRTSPTNIGLSLLANLSAREFGYLSVKEVIWRTQKTFNTLSEMKRYKGHFYNWYDTRTLEPLFPLYISSVDSGNLAGNFIVLSQGLRDLKEKAVYTPAILEGLLDTLRIIQDLDKNNPLLKDIENKLSVNFLPKNIQEAFALLKSVESKIEEYLRSQDKDDKTLKTWSENFLFNCSGHIGDMLYFFPWIEKDWDGFIKELSAGIGSTEPGAYVPEFNLSSTLKEIAGYEDTLCHEIEEKIASFSDIGNSEEKINYYTEWLNYFSTSVKHAQERIKTLDALSQQSDDFAQMDFKFLYNKKKNLFTIGYNVIDQHYDEASYDMLASEARLCSYIAIAQGQVPLKHWFSLGRLVLFEKGMPVLLSWSGSMFEYLMPLLLMPNYEDTLLDSTYKGVIEKQTEYGKNYSVPWGISESGYNRTDAHFNYQYRAFGIPSLGLKRGLSKDLVVAPYATALALMVDPQKACKNLQRLSKEGHEGNFGYYEAVDFTPSHLPLNEKNINVFSFMAHHQGMSLVSLSNLLKDNSMQKHFMKSPAMRAYELLLQEKVPHSVVADVISDDSKFEIEGLHALNSNNLVVTRSFDEKVQQPEVNLLSNGRYHLMLNVSGAGYSRWNGLAINRWRKDLTSDNYGMFIYIRDVKTGKFWSAGYQPTLQPVRNYEANFTQAYSQYKQRHSGLDIVTTVCVSPEDDVELRCIKITNHSHKTRELELTTYTEVVIAPLAADEAHPVFSNLFVQTSYNPDNSTLFCTRRERSEDDKPPHLFHNMLVEDDMGGEISFETDRAKFVGRGNMLTNPSAIQKNTALSGTEGSVLDPILSLRRTVTIPPGKTVRVCIALGISETEDFAHELADKYQNIHMTDRAFELAWTHSQVVLYNLNIKESEAQLFQKMAGALIYMNSVLRADSATLKNNRKGQNSLWGYGISGDLPLVIVRISQSSGMELVRQMVQAHAYWRMKGLSVEMLILNEDNSVYRQPLHDEIVGLISTGIEAAMLNKPAGIYIRPIEHIPGEDMVLLESVAGIILSDKQGTLAEQVNLPEISESRIPAFKPNILLSPVYKDTEIPSRNLLFYNGYGGFTEDGKEYVITVYPGKNTPMPWSNVIANKYFGTVISESGNSYTWSENAHEFRLTPWNNDPIKDTSGEAIYIRDEETGKYWSPTPLPAKGSNPYVVRHGFGYSVFEYTGNGIRSELWVYVAPDAPVKFCVLKLKNISDRVRKLSVTGYYEWVMGDTRTKNQQHITTYNDLNSGVLYARNYYNTDFSHKIAFIDMGKHRTVTGNRREFLGKDGNLSQPAAMRQKCLSGKTGAGFDPCGAVQSLHTLSAGEEKEVRIVAGCAQNETDMHTLVNRYRQFGAVRKALEDVWQYWNRTLGTIRIDTPDKSVDVISNGWLLYQTLSCRIWGRSGYYQSGGAYGFRDQLQDTMVLTHAQPEIMREQLLIAARHQFTKGDVQHWWHPPMNRGVRTLFSDDYLWLPYVTYRYVSTIGDTGVLDEVVHFIEGRELRPGEESYYDMPLVSEESATLYEHCIRSIRYGLKFGEHGLPLMGCGDWNDGMNLVGIHGKGESVWLAFFLYDVLLKFSEISDSRGDTTFAGYCREQASQLRENIRKQAWDGNWYMRAFFDNGQPLGSSQSPECKIDILPQSWSIISGAGDPERSRLGMQEVEKYLVDYDAKMIKLFTPAFDKSVPSPGYIQGYVPGVRENGGQYTHGAIWGVMAFAIMGETDKAWELFALLNPVNHGSTEDEINIYKVEPYVVAADVYAAVKHLGRGGWTWYTGSSSWMYRLVMETLLGINRLGTRLKLAPLLHSDWDGYTVHYRYYDTVYHIHIKRIADNSQPRLIVDGKLNSHENLLDLTNDSNEHMVEMYIG